MFVLLRHAHAVNKRAWSGNDQDRPLSERGFRQAEALVEPLLTVPLRRLLTSPALRCRQTLDPLAQRLGVVIESTDLLDRGVEARVVAELAQDPGSTDALLCTHGETLAELLKYWHAGDHIRLTPSTGKIGKDTTQKSGGWVVHGSAHMRAHYLPPPQLSPTTPAMRG
jgi:8-oxo-dGTP diphosphatase